MVLANMCQDKQYASFYASVEGFKILDNGAAEGAIVDTETLLSWAWALDVDEVVAPDVYDNMEGTLDALKRFMPFAKQVKVMVVLQSHSWPEFDIIMHEAIQQGASALALPRVMCKHMGPSARVAAAALIRKETDLPIHCLGCTEHLREAKDLSRQGIVRGIDSSAPVVQGIAGLGLRDKYADRPSDFFTGTFDSPKIGENLDEFRRWCSTPSPR